MTTDINNFFKSWHIKNELNMTALSDYPYRRVSLPDRILYTYQYPELSAYPDKSDMPS
jgi:hypothetical protein